VKVGQSSCFSYRKSISVAYSKYVNIVVRRTEYHANVVRAWRRLGFLSTCVARVSISTSASRPPANSFATALTECKQGSG
jgi:hypothetical protein